MSHKIDISMCKTILKALKILLAGKPIEYTLHRKPVLHAVSSPMLAANRFMAEQKHELIPLSPESKHLALHCHVS